MNALEEEIRALIKLEGPLTVERFMALCLTHPRYGYYTRQNVFGAAGDFITAPEISQMFGELIGLWAAQVWINMGEPAEFRLIELGPGRGTLMADALRAAGQAEGFLKAARLHLVEASAKLRAEQRNTLPVLPRKTEWHDLFSDVPGGPAIIIANEFFDALPIRQFLRRQGQWHECLAGIGKDGSLAFGLSGAAAKDIARAAPDGDVLEICPAGLELARDIGARLAAEKGAALIIDYGYPGKRNQPTLQALRAHSYAPILENPGEADLTAHVDFSALAAAARSGGAAVFPPVTQAALLDRLGLDARADKLKQNADTAQQAEIEAARARLTDLSEGGMGRLFKALTIASPGMIPPPGFDWDDPLMEKFSA